MVNPLHNKKILVTGHTGFVGSWLCAVLSYFGCDVTGFALPEDDGALYGKIKTQLGIKNIYGDLRDISAVRDCIETARPDVIFHIAAFGFVKECFQDPQRAYSSNVQGTLNLLEAVRECGMPCRIVVASSDKVYRNNDKEQYLFRENDPLGGSDPYSASKTCEDILAQSYYDTYLKDSASSLYIIRPSNILGGGDHNMNRLVPGIYYALQNGQTPGIRNPDSVRPWQNILDMTDAYITVAKQAESGFQIFNVGPEPDGIKTVGEIAAYVSGLYGQNVSEQGNAAGSVAEKAYLGLSIEKIKQTLGWKPKKTLEDTLEDIYRFYTQDDGHNTFSLCLSQIESYYRKENSNADMGE